jgi:hypothetical protein
MQINEMLIKNLIFSVCHINKILFFLIFCLIELVKFRGVKSFLLKATPNIPFINLLTLDFHINSNSFFCFLLLR